MPIKRKEIVLKKLEILWEQTRREDLHTYKYLKEFLNDAYQVSTKEQVCKELSDFYNVEVFYDDDKNYKYFYCINNVHKKREKIEVLAAKSEVWFFKPKMPPYLVSIIADFFELHI